MNWSGRPRNSALTNNPPTHELNPRRSVQTASSPTVAPTLIADRTVYAASGTDGRTAPELEPNGEAAREIAALWPYLADAMAEVTA